MAAASDNVFPKVILSEGAAPAPPSSGQVKLYAKTDGLLYSKDDAGAETLVSGGTGGGSGGGAVIHKETAVVTTDSTIIASEPIVDTQVPDLASISVVVPASATVIVHYHAVLTKGNNADRVKFKPYRDGSAIAAFGYRYSMASGENNQHEFVGMWIERAMSAGTYAYTIRHQAALGTTSTTFLEQMLSVEVVDEVA